MYWKRIANDRWRLISREYGVLAWVEYGEVWAYRARRRPPPVGVKWWVWIAAPGQYGYIPLTCSFKKREAAFKYAWSCARMS